MTRLVMLASKVPTPCVADGCFPTEAGGPWNHIGNGRVAIFTSPHRELPWAIAAFMRGHVALKPIRV